MIDATTTEAFWDILHTNVAVQKGGDRVLASEVHAELMEFLKDQDIDFPAVFEGNTLYEIFDLFVDGGAIFITNSYPDMGPEQHTHPIFIECGEEIESKIIQAFPQLADYFRNSFCPGYPRAADAAEVETESPAAPFEGLVPDKKPTQAEVDAEIYQNVDMRAGKRTATGWLLQERAFVGNEIDIGDDVPWRIVHVWGGFTLTGTQMKRVPPPGYITDTFH